MDTSRTNYGAHFKVLVGNIEGERERTDNKHFFVSLALLGSQHNSLEGMEGRKMEELGAIHI